MIVLTFHCRQVFAAGDELSPILSCDIIGVPRSMPVSRSGYSSSSGGKDIGVVVVVVVGLVVGLCSLVSLLTLAAYDRSFNTL